MIFSCCCTLFLVSSLLKPAATLGREVQASQEVVVDDEKSALRQAQAASPNSTKGILGKLRDTVGMPAVKGATILIAAGAPLKALRLEKDAKLALPWKFDAATGVLEIVPGSGDVCTREKYSDFRMHLEFATPENDNPWGNNGNSGVYIQRRYEVQILNSFGREMSKLTKQDCGALYRQRLPDVNASRPAKQWQCYDIAFRAARWEGEKKVANARITVHHNGQLIHDDVELPNKTGAGRKEGPEPDHIRLQDHGNAVKFRNGWILPLPTKRP